MRINDDVKDDNMEQYHLMMNGLLKNVDAVKQEISTTRKR